MNTLDSDLVCTWIRAFRRDLDHGPHNSDRRGHFTTPPVAHPRSRPTLVTVSQLSCVAVKVVPLAPIWPDRSWVGGFCQGVAMERIHHA